MVTKSKIRLSTAEDLSSDSIVLANAVRYSEGFEGLCPDDGGSILVYETELLEVIDDEQVRFKIFVVADEVGVSLDVCNEDGGYGESYYYLHELQTGMKAKESKQLLQRLEALEVNGCLTEEVIRSFGFEAC